MKILIAEDEQRAREGLARLIGTIPVECEIVGQASDGQQALEMIRALHPDVVFTDVKMPYLDGLGLIRAVRAMKLPTEFVVVSAYADFELARQSISLGVAEYLLKPVTLEELDQGVLRLSRRLQGKASFHSKQKKNLREQYPNAHPLILRALVMIQEGYAGKINQRDMAENLGISPEYFSYLFSKNIGTTFSAFLRDYRIEKAKELYRTGSCDRREVPYAVGFTDSKYFSQVFHKITGTTPSEYCQEYC